MALSESPALVGLLFYGQIKVVQGEKCHLGSVPVGLVFHSSYRLTPGCDEKHGGRRGLRWGGGRVVGEREREGGQPLKVPLPWRRCWAKQDFYRWTNKRWGGCLTASLLEAQQLPPNCWDLLLWAASEGNANQHLVVMSDVEHKSFLMGLAVVVAVGSVA